MKKAIYISAIACLAFAAFSCQKEMSVKLPEETCFTASIEKAFNTKTTLTSDLKVRWEDTDIITINGVAVSATPKSTDSTRASFTGKVKDSTTYEAIYPASIYDKGKFLLPKTLTYNPGKFSNIPLWASSSTKSLSFKNIFAVLKVSVCDTVTVKSISISSDLDMNGVFTVVDNKAVMQVNPQKSATNLDCGTGVAGTDFYIPVPAGTYTGKNLKVVVEKGSGVKETMTTDQSMTIEIAAGTIYSFNFRKDGSFRLVEETTINTLL